MGGDQWSLQVVVVLAPLNEPTSLITGNERDDERARDAWTRDRRPFKRARCGRYPLDERVHAGCEERGEDGGRRHQLGDERRRRQHEEGEPCLMFNNTQNLHSTSYRSTTTTTLIVYYVLSDLHYSTYMCVYVVLL